MCSGQDASELSERGFVCIRSLVSADQLARLRVASETLDYAAAGPYGSICHNPWRRDPAFMAVAEALELHRLVRELAGVASPVWFQDHLINKLPAGGQAIAWHQDYSYWPLDRCDGVTLWIALDDAGTDNGCLEYAAGTHLGGERRPADFTVGAIQPRRLEALEPIDEAAADRVAAAIEVRAGDALAHHPLVWHRSGPNRTERPRRAWSISWISAATRWDPAHAPHPFRTSGEARAGELVAGPLCPRFD